MVKRCCIWYIFWKEKFYLTEKGNEIFQDLNGRSNKQIHHIITKLDDQQCKELIDAMRTVKKHLSIATKNIIVRCFQNKDIEYVIDIQLSLYVSERQFTRQIWKKYLIEGVFKFYRAIWWEKECYVYRGMWWRSSRLYCGKIYTK